MNPTLRYFCPWLWNSPGIRIKENINLDSKRINKRQRRAKTYDASPVLEKHWVDLFRIIQPVSTDFQSPTQRTSGVCSFKINFCSDKVRNEWPLNYKNWQLKANLKSLWDIKTLEQLQWDVKTNIYAWACVWSRSRQALSGTAEWHRQKLSG